MKTQLHLVSMPWAVPRAPSIQTGLLKAFIDHAFDKTVDVHVHNPFVEIPFAIDTENAYDNCMRLSLFEEYSYLLLCLRRFLDKPSSQCERLLKICMKRLNETGYAGWKINQTALNKLETATKKYINGSLVPRLSPEGINLIGFTLNFDQVYSSLYCARYLEINYPNIPCLFLFGGMSASYPHVATALKKFGVRGLGVIGEGEKKLESLVRLSVESTTDIPTLIETAAHTISGTYNIENNSVNLFERHKDFYKTQIASLSDLPLPNFDSYFKLIRNGGNPEKKYADLSQTLYLPFEGTRGCFAKCDFCNLNTTWEGFRKNAPDKILDQSLALAEKYETYEIRFMDNVCDTWAEEYSEGLLAKKISLPAFMELRAHHPEEFWTLLALSGVNRVQIGVESLGSSLLRKMNKGTTVIQNVRVQKWLKELEVRSASNLITHHPKSTLTDVEETRRILELTPHLDHFTMSLFSITLGSPLYEELTLEERFQLEGRHWIIFPKSLSGYIIPNVGFKLPKKWSNRSVLKAWDRLTQWYHDYWKNLGENPTLTVTCDDHGDLTITDRRHQEQTKKFILRGHEASVYKACHQGIRLESITKRTALPPETIMLILRQLVEKSLILKIEDCYLSLALRPRHELIENLYKKMRGDVSRPDFENISTYHP